VVLCCSDSLRESEVGKAWWWCCLVLPYWFCWLCFSSCLRVFVVDQFFVCFSSWSSW